MTASDDDKPPFFRDYVAVIALQSLGTWMPAGFGNLSSDEALKARAVWAYRQADALIAAREASDDSPR